MCTSALSNVLYAYGYQPLGNDWPNQKFYMASAVREMDSPHFEEFCCFGHFSFRVALAP